MHDDFDHLGTEGEPQYPSVMAGVCALLLVALATAVIAYAFWLLCP